ncbi:MAG TPA: hypothetical protein VHB51_04495 [Candidatus Saccharimonadales bacterium]|nr:hypothetical protein [Candidatus Saccharimonadales bacterium]
MQSLLTKLQAQYPALKFVAGEQFCWSPEAGEVVYRSGARGQQATWSLLHEVGHALSEHKNYSSDFQLLQLEMAAWQRARELASELKIAIDEDHIQDCLDSYRDWLHKRSLCPQCGTTCLQHADSNHYSCFNCHTVWRVSSSRFCRAYRASKNIDANSQPAPLVFQ